MAGLPSIFLRNLPKDEELRLTEDISHGILRLSDLERICMSRLGYTSIPIDGPEWSLKMAFDAGEKQAYKTLLDAVTAANSKQLKG